MQNMLFNRYFGIFVAILIELVLYAWRDSDDSVQSEISSNNQQNQTTVNKATTTPFAVVSAEGSTPDLEHEKPVVRSTSPPLNDLNPKVKAGLEALTNLRKLSLVDNKINDISALAGLTKLSIVNLNRNGIVDLRPLSTLKQLSALFINENEVRDLSPLNKLHRLKTLHAAKNNISDLRMIDKDLLIKKLDLSHNFIDSLAPLRRMGRLSTLNLSENPFKSIYPLLFNNALRKLTMINTQNVRCVDLERLEEKVHLIVTRQGDCRL